MPSPAPVDNLYLPGLGQAAVLETQPLNPAHQQVIDQIGPGTFQIDEARASFSRSGDGVSGAHPYWNVQVAAGQTVSIDCTTRPAGGTTPTTAAPTAITGTVSGPDGQPVSGAYVVSVDKLAVARTDAKGQYSMPCGSYTQPQPLVAANWLVPVGPPMAGSYAYSRNTTSYPSPPTTPGPGYVFSGASTNLSGATSPACGSTVNFALPAGASVRSTGTGQSPLPTSYRSTTSTFLASAMLGRLRPSRSTLPTSRSSIRSAPDH
ncbi:MAG: hypothetical protein ACRDX8_00915 [Acidimicrobiales bacterium]